MISDTPQDEAPAGPVLTKQELAEFRQLLLAKKRDLLGDLTGMTAEAKGLKGAPVDEAGPAADLAKYADESDDREITIGLLRSERVLLQEIADALERMDKGTYGVCAGTGQAISKSRLRARPWAKYCIAHARTIEQQQGRAAAMARGGFGGGFGPEDEPSDNQGERDTVRQAGEDDSDEA